MFWARNLFERDITADVSSGSPPPGDRSEFRSRPVLDLLEQELAQAVELFRAWSDSSASTLARSRRDAILELIPESVVPCSNSPA